MNPSRVRFALQKHVPLIKFLGPRSKLRKELVDSIPKPHPTAPKGQRLITINGAIYQKLVIEHSDLPEKYKRKALSFEEIETIDSGGASLIR
ncbi:Small subunit ribosomal protein S36 [Gigaspora margarita]|uniref:Small subunit ribosomal protein S36 n=1 Tax=Gigaspora margarita TaxID=4874 RepID=A0A8H4AA60_GIGMA|nr:Small subunit ribosomal protein S36 [Gigaspora margarita]